MASLREFNEDEAYEYIRIVIDENARELNLKLSRAAKSMLALPLLEFYRDMEKRKSNGAYFSDEMFTGWETSIRKLLLEMHDDPAGFDRFRENESDRSSLSVIKAFAKKFCNIPPFCGETY